MSFLFSTADALELCRSSRLKTLIAWLLVLFGAGTLIANTIPLPHRKCVDFSNVFAGAVCLVHDCSPYRFDSVHSVLVQHGYDELTKDDWATQLPLYPPPTLVLFAPVTGFSFLTARLLVYLLMFAVCALACFRLVLAAPTLAALSPLTRGAFLLVFCLSTAPRWAIHSCNPVILSTGLLLYCCFMEESASGWLPAFCFAIAVLLKPQVALPFALPLWVKPANGKKMVLRGLALVVIVALATFMWCAQHPHLAGWRAELGANLAFGSAAGNDMSDFDRISMRNPRLNLSYMIGYFIQDRRLEQTLASLILIVGLAVLIFGLLKIRALFSPTRFSLGVAAASALTLLLVYHRGYDAVILTAAVPWTLKALADHRHRAAAWTIMFLIVTNWIMWEWYLPSSVVSGRYFHNSPHLFMFISYRFHAILTLLITVMFLALLFMKDDPVSTNMVPNGSEAAA
ncbi:MAG: glycosyltransferase family 87 protein [Acidobacteriota bacterium]